MYVRFVICDRDSVSQQRKGIFQACRDLRDAGGLDVVAEAWADQIFEWFGTHLPRPERFAWSSRPNAPEQAISWFRVTAHEHVLRARELASLLEAAGLPVEMLTTERPGYVVHEDEWQVVAMPFAGDTM